MDTEWEYLPPKGRKGRDSDESGHDTMKTAPAEACRAFLKCGEFSVLLLDNKIPRKDQNPTVNWSGYSPSIWSLRLLDYSSEPQKLLQTPQWLTQLHWETRSFYYNEHTLGSLFCVEPTYAALLPETPARQVNQSTAENSPFKRCLYLLLYEQE